MPKLPVLLLAVSIISHSASVFARGASASDPQALTFAAQSIAALTGGMSINDVTLTGSVIWTAGSDNQTGTATLLALGTGESRIDLALTDGTRTEIRDASTGSSLGKWIAQNGASGLFAGHNCMTDAVWFFPALGSLAGGPNVVFSYVGQESRNGSTVQHIQSHQSGQLAGPGPNPQELSTMDFYLDAATLLPSAITFNVHPDDDAGTSISVEIDFSNYQAVSGVAVPMHIQKYMQGELQIDVTVSSAALNTGIALSNFTIN